MSSSSAMIRLEHVSKLFDTQNGRVEALTDVSLEIEKGSIQGIIGFSGAGKSTLVRCINLLERPTSGKVFIKDRELTAMSEGELREERRKIGMIFQLFNLMKSRTVFSNVAFPLKHAKLTKQEKHDKVMKLLKIVGLENRAGAYPSELSGGQKQRVAIARALASDPDVLLCDEATSALDPQTTQDILKLLKQLNQDLGITIIVITHEMAVVKEICTNVAVMEEGRIVERGDIYSVFSDPQQPITRRFISTTDSVERFKQMIRTAPELIKLREGDVLVQLSFRGESSSDALVSNVSREFDIDISIISGDIELIDGKPLGKLITIIRGNKDNVHRAIRSMSDCDVNVEVLNHA